MNDQRIEVLKQSLLEGGRLIVTALVSYLLTEGVLGFIVDRVFGIRIDPALKFQVTTALTLVLKSIDRALHETDIRVKGLLQF